MIKRRLGFTQSALQELIQASYIYQRAIGLLNQHKMIMTATLIHCYEDYFKKHDQLTLFQNWFRSVSGTDLFENQPDISCVFDTELEAQVKRFSKRIIVYFNEKKPLIDSLVTTLTDLNTKGIKNVLEPYCTPYAIIKRTHDKKRDYLNWLKEWLEDEPHVAIIDPYVFSKYSGSVFEKDYMPIMPRTASINVYYGNNDFVEGTIDSLEKKNTRCTTHKCDNKTFHDRFVSCDSFFIGIGMGFSVFDNSKGTFREETLITVSSEQPPSLPVPCI